MEKNIYLIIFVLLISNPLISNGQKVTALFEKGKYEKAEEYCMKQDDNVQLSCYLELAEAYFNIQNYVKAEEIYHKTANPQTGYQKIAFTYFNSKDYENAELMYAKTANPSDGFLKIANVYFQNTNYKKAEELYAKTNNPNIGFLKIAEKYYSNKNYEKAEALYAKTSTSEKGFLKIADAYINLGSYEKAKDLYAKTNNPIVGYLKIADLYFQQKEYQLSGKYYQISDNKEGLKKIAEYYLSINDIVNADIYLTKAGLMIDNRDKKVYEIVMLNNQIWMAENLAYKPNEGNFWVWGDDEKFLSVYGYLYDYETANNVCPSGWHLPSYEEIKIIIPFEAKKTYKKLIVGGSSGFNFKLGGFRNREGVYYTYDYTGNFWSSSSYSYPSNSVKWGCVFNNYSKDARVKYFDKKMGLSVRCIKN